MEMSRVERRISWSSLGAICCAGALICLLCAGNLFAQGSRKDDVVFNAQGRPMAGATVRICTSAATGQPCAPLALIYSDPALTQALANPISSDGLGNYTFYAAPGRYEIEISGPSITTKQIPNVILPSDPTAPTFATVTTTSGISAFSLTLAGNLTVQGSAAITGSLTVGGAPVPSTTQDNQWTSSQRFKGSDPWRDITAYMPAGGCDQSAFLVPHTTGTITSGTNALTILADNNFKNGCGIFVASAGPLSTLSTPAQGAAPNPNVTGTAGSTTVHYKVAAIDANYGTSAASAAITMTTAPSTRTPLNYVGVYWTSVANAVGYLVYSDAGGSYAPLGYSFDCAGFTAGNTCGIIDKGAEINTWTGYQGFWPTTPPVSATNQALVTTITSGANGGLNLVLAANASNSVSGTFVIPDNSMFIKQAIADASTDGGSQITNKGTVFIPEGLWYMSTIPFPSSGIAGVKIVQTGAIELFGLPVEGNLASGTTGQISITGTGGLYGQGNWTLSCSQIIGYQTLGALFVAYGPGAGIDLSHICLSSSAAGIIQDSQGDVTTQDVSFGNWVSSGPMLQVDNNAFFSLFNRTNWNDSANGTNNNIPAIWFLGLTNNAHSSVFGFRDNSFISHTIRMDIPFPTGGGPTAYLVFDGTTTVEANQDLGFINLATCNSFSNATFDNVETGDFIAGSQSLFYSTSSCGALPGNNIAVHGQTTGFSRLAGSAINSGSLVNCREWTFENPTSGGSGALSIGYWGNIFGAYSGCDLGITQTGYDVQTTEVLTSGGNDTMGPAGEQMIGHVFRRPQTTVTGTGAGSLAAGTYYFKVTAVDVAGRESAPSPEISQLVGASSSISVSATTGIYFPASCNVYFGTSAGAEGNYFNSTAISNGTCTYTLATTAGQLTKSPSPVGNAMRTWLTEENNANSCLFCGFSGGLGTGFLGFNLTAAQYGAPLSGVQFPFNGGVHSYKFYSGTETTAPTGIASVDLLYADSTAHRWKKIENNGAAQTVGSADSAACAYQGPATAVTGTGAAATYYTCTLPAGVMGAGQGVIITVLAKHTTGTAAVSYTLSFGGTSTTLTQPAGAANQVEKLTYIVMNNAGSTSAQTISTVGQDSNAGTNSIKLDTAAVNTSSAVTINLQFNVAATDAITPEMFLVELKQ
ncbi:MAG TPA: hypothetical protein VK709_16135 [Candidatus Saccharimonadales bacterium]|jgi:hypothetical protein|nr:hypothetical protein [Candidatus Saccharimonadales bacterium]